MKVSSWRFWVGGPCTVTIFLLCLFFHVVLIWEFALLLGVIPSLVIPTLGLTLITYQFIHVDFWHFASNMLVLFFFARIVEPVLGWKRFLALYLLSGIGGGLAHTFSAIRPYQIIGQPSLEEAPLIGASGAITGLLVASLVAARKQVLGQYYLLYQAVGWTWMLGQVLASANYWMLGVSYWAHVGGFVSGMILWPLIRPRPSAV